MKRINHGIPKHPYFVIAQPPSVATPTIDQTKPDYKKPVFELVDPKTNQPAKAELHDVWVFGVNDVNSINAFSLLSYGIDGAKLAKVLLKRYPEIEKTQKVHFLLLKKL